jgi:hypothetical protein
MAVFSNLIFEGFLSSTTLRIMTLSITNSKRNTQHSHKKAKLSIMTLSIMTLSIMTLGT